MGGKFECGRGYAPGGPPIEDTTADNYVANGCLLKSPTDEGCRDKASSCTKLGDHAAT